MNNISCKRVFVSIILIIILISLTLNLFMRNLKANTFSLNNEYIDAVINIYFNFKTYFNHKNFL